MVISSLIDLQSYQFKKKKTNQPNRSPKASVIEVLEAREKLSDKVC